MGGCYLTQSRRRSAPTHIHTQDGEVVFEQAALTRRLGPLSCQARTRPPYQVRRILKSIRVLDENPRTLGALVPSMRAKRRWVFRKPWSIIPKPCRMFRV